MPSCSPLSGDHLGHVYKLLQVGLCSRQTGCHLHLFKCALKATAQLEFHNLLLFIHPHTFQMFFKIFQFTYTYHKLVPLYLCTILLNKPYDTVVLWEKQIFLAFIANMFIWSHEISKQSNYSQIILSPIFSMDQLIQFTKTD